MCYKSGCCFCVFRCRNIIFCICKRLHIILQKDTFWRVKGILLQCNMPLIEICQILSVLACSPIVSCQTRANIMDQYIFGLTFSLMINSRCPLAEFHVDCPNRLNEPLLCFSNSQNLACACQVPVSTCRVIQACRLMFQRLDVM